MRKIGVITLAVMLSFVGGTAASAAPAEPRWVTKAGETFDISTVRFAASEVPAFKAATDSVPGYSNASVESLAAIGRDLCEHYAGGFTTEDLRATNGDVLAALGEAAKSTVCA